MTFKKRGKQICVFFFLSVFVISFLTAAVFKFGKTTLASASKIKADDIEYAFVKGEDSNGRLINKKISSEKKLKRIYDCIMNLPSKSSVCFGAKRQSSGQSILLKLKGKSDFVKISAEANTFKCQSCGVFSAFFTRYYDIADKNQFSAFVSLL